MSGAVFPKENFSVDARLEWQQPHDGKRSDRLAGARFSDQAQNLTARNRKADVPDCWQETSGDGRSRLPGCTDGRWRERPRREFYLEAANLKQRVHTLMVTAPGNAFGLREVCTGAPPHNKRLLSQNQRQPVFVISDDNDL